MTNFDINIVLGRLARAAEMRNILVHAYLDIESTQVFFAIAKCLEIYPVYMRQIINYLALSG